MPPDLGLDFISPNKIYAYENTDFEQWVLSQPGYRVEGRRRYVVSDQFGVEDLRKIQARIMLRFLRKHPPWIPYRKALAHPMVEKIGRERMRRAMLRSLLAPHRQPDVPPPGPEETGQAVPPPPPRRGV